MCRRDRGWPVIAVDTSILVYAHRADSPCHREADAALTRLAQSGALWAIPWPCIHEFLAIATHPRIYDPPTPVADALEQVECWLEVPTLLLLGETSAHWGSLKALLEPGTVRGPKVHDARIAAICATNGVKELWTADRDFRGFTGIRQVNPCL